MPDPPMLRTDLFTNKEYDRGLREEAGITRANQEDLVNWPTEFIFIMSPYIRSSVEIYNMQVSI